VADERLIIDLLHAWEEGREDGREPSPEELCPDDKELCEELRQRIARRRLFNPVLSPHPAVSPAGSLVIPNFEVLSLIGQGGMGVVYKARQESLNRLVALKKLVPWMQPRGERLSRFRAEAKAAARISHPNIVQVYEFGEHEGHPYLALEYIDGGSLDQQIKDSPQPPREAATLVKAVALAVEKAHQAGVIHRDLKPGNILVARDGTPKVSDFGLAKLIEEDSGQTKSKDVLGTPSYMAPEQAGGGSKFVTEATDIYSLGAILYKLLTGHPPFQGTTPAETLLLVREQEPVPPSRSRPTVPRDLEVIVLKCLEKDPLRRYMTAQALADDLEAWLEGRAILARPPGKREQAWRWAKRHRTLAVLGGIVAPLAFLGLLIGLFLVNRERVRADQNFDRAEKFSQNAFDTITQLLVVMDHGDISEVQVAPLLKELLTTGTERYEGLVRLRADEPTTLKQMARSENRLAEVHSRLAETNRRVENWKEAMLHAERAILHWERLLKREPDSATYLTGLADSLERLVVAQGGAGVPGFSSGPVVRRGIELNERLLRHPRANKPYRLNRLAMALQNIGIVEQTNGNISESLRWTKRAVEAWKEAVHTSAENTNAYVQLGACYRLEAFLSRMLGRSDEGLNAIRSSIESLRECTRRTPTSLDYQEQLANAYNDHGNLLEDVGRFGDAMTAHRQSLSLFDDLDLVQFPDIKDRAAILRSRVEHAYHVARLAFRTSLWPEAETYSRRVEEEAKILEAVVPPDAMLLQRRVEASYNLGTRSRLVKGEPIDEPRLRRAGADALATFRGTKDSYAQAVTLLILRANRVELRRQGRFKEADSLLERERASFTHPASLLVDVGNELGSLYHLAACRGDASSVKTIEETKRCLHDEILMLCNEAVMRGFRDVGKLKQNPAAGMLEADPRFRDLLADAIFPTDPFGTPSPQ
jgi:tRNA A-37 threonylcarbamoyl transferase component Bud32/tetratricopeptide (TPR) repeat protein